MSPRTTALKDLFISTEHRFSLGIEEASGRYYLSIPVSNAVVDYEEYYAIGVDEFERFRDDLRAALEFAQRCRMRLMDSRLIVQPGANRGTTT